MRLHWSAGTTTAIVEAARWARLVRMRKAFAPGQKALRFSCVTLAIAGISERSARAIDNDPVLPSRCKRKRHWRTRKDPPAAVWPRAVEFLESTPGLMAVC